MKNQESKIHHRLAKFRQKRGLSMKRVAGLLQVPESTYREWEYGRAIQGEPYIKLAEIFGVSVYELLGGTKPELKIVLHALDGLEEGLKIIRTHVGSFY